MVWICKTKIWWKWKTLLYGYKQLHVKTDGIYKDVAEDVEKRFDTYNFEIDRPLPTGKDKKSDWINERWIRWRNHEKKLLD